MRESCAKHSYSRMSLPTPLVAGDRAYVPIHFLNGNHQYHLSGGFYSASQDTHGRLPCRRRRKDTGIKPPGLVSEKGISISNVEVMQLSRYCISEQDPEIGGGFNSPLFFLTFFLEEQLIESLTAALAPRHPYDW